jgi:hypothetical protein
MEQVYIDTDKIAFSCCFILAVLATIAYGRWHYWWRSGSGRARMAMMVAFAGITLERAARDWITFQYHSIPDHVVDMIKLSSAALASAALAYLLVTMITLNIQRVRAPGFAADRGRRYLEQTPWASDEKIGKLIAAWDEMHSSGGPNHPSIP